MQKCFRFLNTAGTKLILTGTFHTSRERRTWNPRVLIQLFHCRSHHVCSSSVQSLHKLSDRHSFQWWHVFRQKTVVKVGPIWIAVRKEWKCWENRFLCFCMWSSVRVVVFRLPDYFFPLLENVNCGPCFFFFFFFNCMLKGWSKIASEVC